MESLSARDRELVSLGAALASNCVPCIEHHVPEARKAGLSDEEIGEAIGLADKVRQVPAATVLKVAWSTIGKQGEPSGSACVDDAARVQTPNGAKCCG